MNNRLNAAIRYQLADYRTSILVFVGINITLILLVMGGFFFIEINGEISYTAYAFAAAIFMLVCGIVGPRPALRLCAQLGTGRKSAFLSLFPAAVVAALVLALMGEVIVGGAQILSRNDPHLFFSDLYAMTYMGWDATLTLPQHLQSVIFHTCLMLACYGFGVFCTALFWRLNKIGCIIAGISMAACFIFGLPLLSIYVQIPMMLLMEFFIASPWNGMAVFLVIFLFFSIIAWFLVRNVHIRAASK